MNEKINKAIERCEIAIKELSGEPSESNASEALAQLIDIKALLQSATVKTLDDARLVEEANKYAKFCYAQAPKQSKEDAGYIQAVAASCFIQGAKSICQLSVEPKELPSDEEIEKWVMSETGCTKEGHAHDCQCAAMEEAAKWMRSKIKSVEPCKGSDAVFTREDMREAYNDCGIEKSGTDFDEWLALYLKQKGG